MQKIVRSKNGFVLTDFFAKQTKFRVVRIGPDSGRVFTTTIVSLNIPEGVLFTDFVKRLKNDRCFHELN